MDLRVRDLFCLLVLLCCASQTQADNLAEYRIKAGFIYNFVLFTEWPAEVGGNLNICVYGPDPFGEELDNLQGKKAGRRVLAVRRVTSMDDLGDCQAIYIARPAIGNLSRVLDNLNGRPVLTIADSPGAMRKGAILNMNSDQGKVTFEANLTAARGSGLNLSSQLLRLATEVRK
jgi:hypothetical protein